ncbi:MAG: hypothetical protein R3330_06210, partial [Saprospiraceae bacterium]|nr:hypothetical protein [Saprospiraceae bacterium]
MRLYIFLVISCCIFLSESNGQVGVGTTNPSDALHVAGASGDHALRVQVGGSTRFRVLSNGGTTIGINNVAGTPANGLYVSGNTGLGTSFPTDRLAVNGDVNITGEIKTSGIAGTEGQVLTSTGAGQMAWMDPGSFEHLKDFFNPAAANNWTVPAGVTEIVVEIWGAGGGGAPGGGGGAGGYVYAKLTVSPGDVYTFNLGEGGQKYFNGTPATGGGNTEVTGPGIGILRASGGAAATAGLPGLGGTSSISSNLSATRWRGSHGQTNEVTYAEYATGSFAEIIHFGRGGHTPNALYTGGAGAVLAANYITTSEIYSKSARAGVAPGGGGGGGDNT